MPPLQLGVTDRDASFQAVADAKARFGGLDVVVNDARCGLLGPIEGPAAPATAHARATAPLSSCTTSSTSTLRRAASPQAVLGRSPTVGII